MLGEVVGNVEASDKVTIRDSGMVEGDIVAPRVAIAEGARFRGKIDMQRGPKRPKRSRGPRANRKGPRSRDHRRTRRRMRPHRTHGTSGPSHRYLNNPRGGASRNGSRWASVQRGHKCPVPFPEIMSRPIVALLSDFGSRDHYAGTMKGVILGILSGRDAGRLSRTTFRPTTCSSPRSN